MSDGPSTSAVDDPPTSTPTPAPQTIGRDGQQSVEVAPQPSTPKKIQDPALKKRDDFLRELLIALDTLVYIELAALYYLDVSTALLLLRSLLYFSQVTIPHVTTQGLPAALMYRKPPLTDPNTPLLLAASILCLAIHALTPAPIASELTRFHLHGSLIVDFVGQYAVGGWWARMRLCVLDLMVIMIQGLACAVAIEKQRSSGKPKEETISTGNISQTPTGAIASSAMGRAVPERILSGGEDPTAIELQPLTPQGRRPNVAADSDENTEPPSLHDRASFSSSSSSLPHSPTQEHQHLLSQTNNPPPDPHNNLRNDDDNDDNNEAIPQSHVQALETLYSGQIVVAELHLLDMVRNSFWEQRNRRLRGSV